MTAANIVQGLAIVLVVAIANNQDLPAKAKWTLLLLALQLHFVLQV